MVGKFFSIASKDKEGPLYIGLVHSKIAKDENDDLGTVFIYWSRHHTLPSVEGCEGQFVIH